MHIKNSKPRLVVSKSKTRPEKQADDSPMTNSKNLQRPIPTTKEMNLKEVPLPRMRELEWL